MKASILVLVLLFCGTAIAQDSKLLEPSSESATNRKPVLKTAFICERIRELKAFNAAITFPRKIGKVACYSSFDPVYAKTKIYHSWYHRDQLSSRKKLNLKPPRWSSFSSIQLREGDKGPWRVEIHGENGQPYAVLRFSIVD